MPPSLAQKLAQKAPPSEASSHPIPKTIAIPTSLSEVNRRLKEKPVPAKESGEKAAKEVTNPKETRPREPFNSGKVQAVLEDIIYAFKEQGKNMEISILRQPVEVTGEKVVFFLNGEIQKDIFSKIRQEITLLLRKGLKNYNVDLSFEIKEDAVSPAQKLYTSTDKLNYLREKSPALKELQQRFGLETDF